MLSLILVIPFRARASVSLIVVAMPAIASVSLSTALVSSPVAAILVSIVAVNVHLGSRVSTLRLPAVSIRANVRRLCLAKFFLKSVMP